MDPTDQTGFPQGRRRAGESGAGSAALLEEPAAEPVTAPRLYQRCDRWTGVLLYAAVVFAPWAFGATQTWAVGVLTGAGLGLGLLLGIKRSLRWRTGYQPPRWGEEALKRGQPGRFRPHARAARWLTRSLATGTIIVVGYCLVSALNERATYRDGIQTFNDHFLVWLPHSYDADASWASFWRYLGLAGFFWAARDWLLGKSPREREPEEPLLAPQLPPAPLPDRLARLLWVLCLNGAALGVVCILQRLDGTDRLLWLMPSRAGGPDFHFGPFNYRGNGAQYFNLLWPVSLAFWWTLFRASQAGLRAGTRIGGEPHLVLLPCALVQAACPVISASHGGAVIAAVQAIAALGVLLVANWRSRPTIRVAMLTPFAVGVGVAAYLGWNQFQVGFLNAFQDDLGDRVEIYQHAHQMAVDHPLFGTGPGTFPAMYQLYRSGDPADAAAYAHDDWLQTVITFGWMGAAFVLLLLLHPFLRWWARDGIQSRGDLVVMIWVALVGALFHARFDFPFQIYAVLQLFLLLSCITCCVGRKP